jgi:hypothetical protein
MRWRSKPWSNSSARLLRIRLELLFERRKLGEGRIRIGLAAVPAVSASLNIFRTQRRIAVRTVPARATLGPLATLPAIATLRTIERSGGAATRATVWAGFALRPLDAVGRRSAVTSALPPFVASGRRSSGLGRSCGSLIGRTCGDPSRGRSRSSLPCATRPTAARNPVLPRLACMLVAAAGPPHLDQLRPSGLTR